MPLRLSGATDDIIAVITLISLHIMSYLPPFCLVREVYRPGSHVRFVPVAYRCTALFLSFTFFFHLFPSFILPASPLNFSTVILGIITRFLPLDLEVTFQDYRLGFSEHP